MSITKNIPIFFLLFFAAASMQASDQIQDLIYVPVTDVTTGQQTSILIPPSGTGSTIQAAYDRVHAHKPNYTRDVLYRDRLIGPKDVYDFNRTSIATEDLCVLSRKRKHSHKHQVPKNQSYNMFF